MSEYFIGALIAIGIYSLILTIILLYKDNSGYFCVEALDVIMSGPFAWITFLVFGFVISPVYEALKDGSAKSKAYKKRSTKYIKKTVDKVIRGYRKKKEHDDYINFKYRRGDDMYHGYEGYGVLLTNKARFEWLNKRFERLMYYQKEELLVYLLTFFEPVTEEYMRSKDNNEYYIEKYKDVEMYTLKEEYL